MHDLVAQNVEATPARMFLLAGVLGRIRSAGNMWRWAVVASQAVGIVVGIAVLRVRSPLDFLQTLEMRLLTMDAIRRSRSGQRGGTGARTHPATPRLKRRSSSP